MRSGACGCLHTHSSLSSLRCIDVHHVLSSSQKLFQVQRSLSPVVLKGVAALVCALHIVRMAFFDPLCGRIWFSGRKSMVACGFRVEYESASLSVASGTTGPIWCSCLCPSSAFGSQVFPLSNCELQARIRASGHGNWHVVLGTKIPPVR